MTPNIALYGILRSSNALHRWIDDNMGSGFSFRFSEGVDTGVYFENLPVKAIDSLIALAYLAVQNGPFYVVDADDRHYRVVGKGELGL
jgi:hypothetical protein